MIKIEALALAAFVAACSSQSGPESRPTTTTSPATTTSAPIMTSPPSPSASAEPIGQVEMLPDGSLVLDLHRAGGMHVSARTTYKKGDPGYDDVIAHVGGLHPGETKLVPPWPDEIDDAKVEASVKSYMQKEQGWPPDETRVLITGTDAQGRTAVSASRAGAPGTWSLRLDATTNAVVSAEALKR